MVGTPDPWRVSQKLVTCEVRSGGARMGLPGSGANSGIDCRTPSWHGRVGELGLDNVFGVRKTTQQRSQLLTEHSLGAWCHAEGQPCRVTPSRPQQPREVSTDAEPHAGEQVRLGGERPALGGLPGRCHHRREGGSLGLPRHIYAVPPVLACLSPGAHSGLSPGLRRLQVSRGG